VGVLVKPDLGGRGNPVKPEASITARFSLYFEVCADYRLVAGLASWRDNVRGGTMFVDTLTAVLTFLALGTLGVAMGALRSSRSTEPLGDDRLELLREERRTPTEELALERRERLEAQRRAEQLTREHPQLGARARTPARYG
jgi:hypothetical protein